MYLLVYTAVMTFACALLALMLWLETRENARLHQEIRTVYGMLGDAIEGAGNRVALPIRRGERPASHGENVRPDGLIERSNGQVVDAAGQPVDVESIYTPEGGPQAMSSG